MLITFNSVMILFETFTGCLSD